MPGLLVDTVRWEGGKDYPRSSSCTILAVCARSIHRLPMSLFSAIDDVVLDYVIEVISNLEDENSFDIDQLCEMIAAYVPEFAVVDRYVWSVWIV